MIFILGLIIGIIGGIILGATIGGEERTRRDGLRRRRERFDRAVALTGRTDRLPVAITDGILRDSWNQ